jgi:hypothetical protein
MTDELIARFAQLFLFGKAVPILPRAKQIPDMVRQRIIRLALDAPALSPCASPTRKAIRVRGFGLLREGGGESALNMGPGKRL